MRHQLKSFSVKDVSDSNSIVSRRCRFCPWLIPVVVTAVLLLLIELVLQVIDFNPSTNPRWRVSSEFGWVSDRSGYAGKDEMRDTGFRSASWLEDCPAERTVVVLGDSFSFSAAVKYRDSFPGRLETLLNAGSQERWCVVNLSVGDWGNVQQLLAYNYFFAEQAPRLVVWQIFPLNDFCNSAIALKDTCSLQDHFRPYLLDAAVLTTTSDCGGSLLACWVKTIVIGWQRAQKGLDPYDRRSVNEYFRATAKAKNMPVPGSLAGYVREEKQTQTLKMAWQQWEEVLAAMTDLIADQDIESVAFMIPYARSVAENREAFVNHHAKKHVDPTYAFNRVKNFLHNRVTTIIDFSEVMERQGFLAKDMFLLPKGSHLSKAGHEASAQEIARIVRQLVELN